jgi:hypothetical protein
MGVTTVITRTIRDSAKKTRNDHEIITRKKQNTANNARKAEMLCA